MTFALKCHPDAPTEIITSISVSHEWRAQNLLWVRYHVEMPPQQLYLPESAEPERMDNLWHTTCFELFLRDPSAAAYCELNLSPSSCWAAYGFLDYREGAHDMDVPDAPKIAQDVSDTHFALEAVLTLPDDCIFPELAAAISAIMVTVDGHKSFWGYEHPVGAPDFHHADCFAARLRPSEAA